MRRLVSVLGFTAGLSWHETSTHSEITNSKKDIYATATGELVTYLLIDGLIEIRRQYIRMSGYCWAIK